MLIAFNKPFDVLSQFTKELPRHRTLADYAFPPDVYPIGRLDRDSEGLLLLSNEPKWTHRLLHPKFRHPRTYLVQVEGQADNAALDRLRKGVVLKDGASLPCEAELLVNEPVFPPRDPPVRFRLTVPTSWIQLTLKEGRNRQVRRMTAAVNLPTLRLIRESIGSLNLASLDLEPGVWRTLTAEEISLLPR